MTSNISPDDDTLRRLLFRSFLTNAAPAIIGFILAVAICALLPSCSTHKSVCGVTAATADSLMEYIRASEQVTKKDSSLSLQSNVTEQQQRIFDWDNSESFESVIEQITESLDSAGNSVRTTSRTILRKSAQSSLTDQTVTQRQKEEALSVYLSMLDSMYEASKEATKASFSSLSEVKETPITEDSRPWYKRWGDAIEFIFVGFLVCALIYIYIKVKN